MVDNTQYAGSIHANPSENFRNFVEWVRDMNKGIDEMRELLGKRDGEGALELWRAQRWGPFSALKNFPRHYESLIGAYAEATTGEFVTIRDDIYSALGRKAA